MPTLETVPCALEKNVGDTVAESNAQLVHIIAWSLISSIFCFMVVSVIRSGVPKTPTVMQNCLFLLLRLEGASDVSLEFIQRMRGKMAFSLLPHFFPLVIKV